VTHERVVKSLRGYRPDPLKLRNKHPSSGPSNGDHHTHLFSEGRKDRTSNSASRGQRRPRGRPGTLGPGDKGLRPRRKNVVISSPAKEMEELGITMIPPAKLPLRRADDADLTVTGR